MPRKNVIRALKIDEISGVDNPAQEGARVSIMKRAEPQQKWLFGPTIDQEAMGRAVMALVTKHKGDLTMPNDNDPTKETLAEALKVANAIIKLNGIERKHFDTLDEEAKKKFILKSADDRKAAIDAVKQAKTDSDPVEYTTADGVEIRKSAGVALITALKSNDDMRKENKKLLEQHEQEELEKRAETDLKYLSGDVKVRAAMLKAVDGIEDEDQRKAAHNALKSQNEAMAEAFKTRGHTGGQSEPGSPDEELDKLAKAHAEKNSVSEAAAYSAVLETEQGQELYAKSVN